MPDQWHDAFYVTTFVDSEAVIRPHLKARGERVVGPYATYDEAREHGEAQNCTHFTIQKTRVKNDVPFLKPGNQDT